MAAEDRRSTRCREVAFDGVPVRLVVIPVAHHLLQGSLGGTNTTPLAYAAFRLRLALTNVSTVYSRSSAPERKTDLEGAHGDDVVVGQIIAANPDKKLDRDSFLWGRQQECLQLICKPLGVSQPFGERSGYCDP